MHLGQLSFNLGRPQHILVEGTRWQCWCWELGFFPSKELGLSSLVVVGHWMTAWPRCLAPRRLAFLTWHTPFINLLPSVLLIYTIVTSCYGFAYLEQVRQLCWITDLSFVLKGPKVPQRHWSNFVHWYCTSLKPIIRLNDDFNNPCVALQY